MLANNAWRGVSVELSQLRYLVKIAECQSVSKAAKALNISTQGISSSIRRLENELNVTLFYRSGGKLQLTELGELIQEEARYALSRVDQITKVCAGHTKGATSIPIAITKSKFIRMPIALQTLLLTPPEDYTVTMDHQLTVNCVDMVQMIRRCSVSYTAITPTIRILTRSISRTVSRYSSSTRTIFSRKRST